MARLMSRVELTRNVGTRRIVPTLLIVATMLGLDPNHFLQEGSISMAKKAFADEMRAATRDNTIPPARSSEIAVAEEYRAARQRGTAQALELFLARHPDSNYAEKARADLGILSR